MGRFNLCYHDRKHVFVNVVLLQTDKQRMLFPSEGFQGRQQNLKLFFESLY